MSKKWIRILSLIMSVILVLGLITGALVTIVSAATVTHQLATLLKEGKIKALGRTQVNTTNDGITANWSANGFEMNVNSNGGDFVVGYKTSLSTCYAAVLVDGKQVLRTALYGTGTIKVPLTAGKHTVSAIREQGHTNSTTAYLHFTTVAFDGTVEAKPADKKLFIEVVGDSYACGAGSAADYEPGVLWGDADHSSQASFGWFLSKKLGSDLSIVARGGIGLFDGTSEQEGTPNTVTMRDIYPYASGHNQSDGLYDFARKPDLVVIELGANDTIKSSDPTKTISNWAAKLREMISLVREKNGANTKILLLNHDTAKYVQMLRIADEDANIWACHFSHHGNGSAAKTTQISGHPNADDEREIAEALYKSIQDNEILGKKSVAEPSYTDINYYVSENGDDANDGKTPETAMKTIKAVTAKVQADNGGKTGFAAGTRIVINVTGEVYQSTGSHQYMGGGQAFYETGTGVKAHKFIPMLITTYNYSGTPATIVYDNDPTDEASASLLMVNNVYLKDINVKSITNEATGYAVNRIFASNTEFTIDNVTFDGDEKWSIFADHHSTGGFNPTKTEWLPFYGTVTFKNGDYTNLKRVAAVGADSLTNGVTELPDVHCKVVIEDGAKMGEVNVAYGTIAVESATVELNGGTVERILPTPSGKSGAVRTYNTDIKTVFNGSKVTNARYVGTGNYNVINGNLTNEFKRGQYIGTLFAGVGSNTTVNGTVTNNISGGEIRLNPTNTSQGNDGIWLGGFKSVTINGELINNISGGDLNLIFDAHVKSGIYMGLRSGKINGNLTNNISGGKLMAADGATTAEGKGIYMGMYEGNISGTLTNNISAGNLAGGLNLGDQTVGNAIGKIVNVLGVKGSLQGPRIHSEIHLGGGWARLGADKGNRALTAEDCSDTVVLDNTIYSGYFGGIVYAGVNGSKYNTTHSYVSGSVKTNIYGGKFNKGFAGTSGAAVAGHVTTNIYGGEFTAIYGTRTATVFDGVETNIYGITDLYPTQDENITYGIWAGGNTGKVSAKTEGRDAVKLTIAPEKNEDVILRTPICAGFAGSGSATGTTTVTVSGGIYPNGFKVDGKTVGEVLASGYAAYGYQSGAKLSYAASDASISGNVEIRSGAPAAGRTLTYYVRPNGNNSNDGTTFISAKKTIKAAIDQAVADNGGSRVFPNGTKLVVYVDGTVNTGAGQSMGYYNLLTTADGKHLETVVTTYNYSATNTKATLVQDHTPTDGGSSSVYLGTDMTFKDVDIVSRKTSGGFVTQNLYAAGCNLTFDNANLYTDCGTKWMVAADHFATGGQNAASGNLMEGSVTFRNGDYTNLSYVTTNNAGSIWISSGNTLKEAPNMHCKIVIEDGAKMVNVYGPVGGMKIGSATVEVRGGEVRTVYGTGSGTKNINIDTTVIVSGGTIGTLYGTGVDANVKLTGNVNLNVTGGTIGTFYGSGTSATVNGNITTTISSGSIGSYVGTGASGIVNGDIITTVSGGTIESYVGTVDSATLSGAITTTISGGTIESYVGTGASATLSGAITTTLSGGTIESYVGTGASATLSGAVTTTVSGATVNAFSATGESATVNADMATTISSGTVNNFNGTGKKTKVTGNITQVFSGGNIGGAEFNGLADSTTLTGDLTNTFSGAALEINPTGTDAMHGIYLSGRGSITINGNVTNTISAGSLGVLYKVTGIDSGIYMGLRGGWIKGDLTNNITGGTIYIRAENKDITPGYAGIHTTGYYGASVSGTVYNNIIGGTFETTSNGNYYLGQRGVSGSANRVVNVIGDKETGAGPEFLNNRPLNVAGGWGRIGVTNNSSTQPTDGVVETVVVDNTIYGGTFTGDVLATLNASVGTYVTYIKGSVKTAVYGGEFTNFYANGNSPTYGHVTTDIYGGTFNSIYGARVGKVCGNVTLNIHGMTEGEKPTGIWAAGITAPIVGNVRLTIQPKDALTLSMPISAGHSGNGSVTGTTSAYVTGGTYTKGFAVTGVTVKEALAEGLLVLKNTDKTLVTVTSDMTTTGTDSVTLITGQWNGGNATLALSDTTVTYDGKTNAKVPTETVKFHNTTLVKGTDYTVAYSRDGAATTDFNSLGTVTVTVTAKAPYSGTLSTTYTIVRDSAVGNAIANVTQRTAAYDINTVTADDSADLAALKGDIKAILTDNASVLTEEEKTALNGLTTTVESLEKVISVAATDLNTLGNRISDYDIATVTADDATGLKMLGTALTRIKDSNLTAAQKARKQELQSQLAALSAKIDDVAALMADAEAELAKYTAATVTADHSAALTELASDIAAIPDGNLTSQQKTEKQTMANQVAALQKVITDTAAEIAWISAESASFDAATLRADDAAALAALKARTDAIADGNLTAAQKVTKQNVQANVAHLQSILAEVANELAAVKTEVAKYNADSVTADSSAKLQALADRIAAISDIKLTAAQKSEKKAAADQVAALQKVITDTAAALTTAAGKVDAINTDTLTEADAPMLKALLEEINAIPDANLTTAQKTQKQNLADAVKAMQKSIAGVAEQLAELTAQVNGYNAATVTGDQSAALTSLQTQLNAISDAKLTAAQKSEKQALLAQVAALQKVIADTADALAAVKTEAAAYSAATVTADDTAALAALAADIAAVKDANLTAAQKSEKQAAAAQVTALQKVITDTAAALAAVKTEAAGYSAATVTADDTAALAALAADIAAVKDANLTAAQKSEKQAAAAQVTALQKVITDTAAALKTVCDAANGYNASTVKSSDTAALAALAADIAAVKDANLTAAQKSEKQAAADKVAAMQKVITDTAAALAAVTDAALAYNAETVTADDLADLDQLTAAVNAIADGNLTEGQKADKTAILDKVAGLRKVVADTEAALKALEDDVAAYASNSVTADDSAELTTAANALNGIADSKLSAAQKTRKQEAIAKVAALQKVITDTAKALEEAKEEADKFDPATVNSENTEALAAVAAQIAAIPDGNLTAAQKSEKKAASDAVAAMQKTIADTAADLKALEDAEAAFDPAALTSADKAKLQQLQQQMEAYPTAHLTTAEQAKLAQLVQSVKDKVAAIEKAEELSGSIDEIAKLLEGKTTANITSESNADLIAARNAITELKKNTALTDADKQRVVALEKTLEELEEQLEKAEDAAEVPASVQTVKPENVELQDKTGLSAAIKALEDAEKNFAANYTAAEKQAIADTKAKLEAALAVIEEVEAVQTKITNLPATAEPDDEKAIADLQAALDAFSAMNERQKAMVTAAELAKVEKLSDSLKDYKIVKGDKGTWTQESKKDLTFTVNGLFGKFEGVQVDGSTVDSKYYTVKSGSTIITLTDEFLDKLAKGEHTITAVYTDGKVNGTFTVKAKSASPATGDDTNVALLSLLAVFSVASAAALTIGFKKRAR